MSDAQVGKLAWLQLARQRYEPPLLRCARRIVGSGDSARDIVQDTYVRLLESEEVRVEVEGPVKGWLFRVCRNRALDEQRRIARRQTPLHQPTAQGSAPPAAELLERREILTRVVGAVQRLPQRQQQILRMRFEGGLSYQQIAAATGLTATNVGYLIHVAIRSLRDELRETGTLREEAR